MPAYGRQRTAAAEVAVAVGSARVGETVIEGTVFVPLLRYALALKQQLIFLLLLLLPLQAIAVRVAGAQVPWRDHHCIKTLVFLFQNLVRCCC